MKKSLWVDKGQEERRKEGEGEPDAGPIVGGWSLFRKMVIVGIRYIYRFFFKRMSNIQF